MSTIDFQGPASSRDILHDCSRIIKINGGRDSTRKSREVEERFCSTCLRADSDLLRLSGVCCADLAIVLSF
jgi:hypothetical protein